MSQPSRRRVAYAGALEHRYRERDTCRAPLGVVHEPAGGPGRTHVRVPRPTAAPLPLTRLDQSTVGISG